MTLASCEQGSASRCRCRKSRFAVAVNALKRKARLGRRAEPCIAPAPAPAARPPGALAVQRGMATKPKKATKKAYKRATKPERTPKEAYDVIGRLFALYGIRSTDGEASRLALYCAARDGLLRVPGKRGAPSKWRGMLGLELVRAVEALQAQGMSIRKAIDTLRDQDLRKWADDDLEKRFYDGRRFWGLGPGQFGHALPPFINIPEN